MVDDGAPFGFADGPEGPVYATDGQPNEDSVRRRREARQSLIESAAESEPADELFPMGHLPGDGISLRNLIAAGTSVEVTTSMRRAEVPTLGGLSDPTRRCRSLVTCEVEKYEPVPIKEGEKGSRQVTGWKIRQVLRPIYIEDAEKVFTAQQVVELLQEAGVSDSTIAELIDTEGGSLVGVGETVIPAS